MAVRILKVAGIAAPERRLSGFHDDGAGRLCLSHDRIDLFAGTHIMTECELRRTALRAKPRVMLDALSRPQCQAQSGLQLEENDGTEFKLSADDAIRHEAHRPIKAQRPFKVVYAKRDHRNGWPHTPALREERTEPGNADGQNKQQDQREDHL